MLRGIARVGPRLAFSLSIGERDAIPGLPPPSTEIADLPSITLWDVPAELRATPATIARHVARRPRAAPDPTPDGAPRTARGPSRGKPQATGRSSPRYCRPPSTCAGRPPYTLAPTPALRRAALPRRCSASTTPSPAAAFREASTRGPPIGISPASRWRPSGRPAPHAAYSIAPVLPPRARQCDPRSPEASLAEPRPAAGGSRSTRSY